MGLDINEVVMRGMWKGVVSEEETDWIDSYASEAPSDLPCGDLPLLIQEMREKGVSDQTIARFAKIMQYSTLFHIAYHLSDPCASYEDFDDIPEDEQVWWSLFVIDPDELTPKDVIIDGLHEVALLCDPSEKEMRP